MLYKKRRKYKYTLFREEVYDTGIIPDEAGSWGPLAIDVKGVLTVSQGYAWDGPSGPAIDSHTFMRSSLIHDCLYQLMREQKIGQHWRKRSDEILREICIVDGMAKVRAWWVYRAVRMGAAQSAKPDLLTAPRRRRSI
jgi:hypothetical protein